MIAHDTRREAFERIGRVCNKLQREVLLTVVESPSGLTDGEIAEKLRRSDNTTRPRRRELVAMKLLKRGPDNRRTKSGRNAAVWIADESLTRGDRLAAGVVACCVRCGSGRLEETALANGRVRRICKSCQLISDHGLLPADEGKPAPEPRGRQPAGSNAKGPSVAWLCRYCGYDRHRDFPIHQGRSTRRDCARCGRTICFPVWNPVKEAGA